jgi:hypothetical protein
LTEVLRESILAQLDLLEEPYEKLLSSFPGTGLNDARGFLGFSHHFFEGAINLLESSGVIGKLSSDIFSGQEDWFESLPGSLHLGPDVDDGVHSLQSFLPVQHSILELFDIL